jgi:hypothetical protein
VVSDPETARAWLRVGRRTICADPALAESRDRTGCSVGLRQVSGLGASAPRETRVAEAAVDRVDGVADVGQAVGVLDRTQHSGCGHRLADGAQAGSVSGHNDHRDLVKVVS